MDDQINLCHHKLENQLQHLNALTQLLDAELECLASKKGDGLKDIAREKLTLLNTIQKLDKEISGFNQEIFESDPIKPLTKSVNALLLQCKKQNDVNAQAAHQAHMAVKELKDIIIGAPTSITYGQDGGVVSANSELVKNLKA
ncbi:flagellar export chaperone FlgN [Pseudoalteromonas phenolica]|uniref:flagellar export chaperone FlgN n=1 Tax=Pseudoalteromonas phenolica TaxID=161398 RepID=UPI00385088DD